MYLRAVGLFFGVDKSCDVSAAAESLARILGRGRPLDDESGRDDVECNILETRVKMCPVFIGTAIVIELPYGLAKEGKLLIGPCRAA